MTRINSAISPRNLTDQHLLAELRELPRIFTAVFKRLEKGKGFEDIPAEFTLGSGHCKFFYNKLIFLSNRHNLLRKEYYERFSKGYSIYQGILIDSGDYAPTEKEKQLLIERITTRILESYQTPRYYGKSITKQRAIEILNS